MRKSVQTKCVRSVRSACEVRCECYLRMRYHSFGFLMLAVEGFPFEVLFLCYFALVFYFMMGRSDATTYFVALSLCRFVASSLHRFVASSLLDCMAWRGGVMRKRAGLNGKEYVARL